MVLPRSKVLASDEAEAQVNRNLKSHKHKSQLSLEFANAATGRHCGGDSIVAEERHIIRVAGVTQS